MKKILVITLTVILIFCLFGCQKDNVNTQDGSSNPKSNTTSTQSDFSKEDHSSKNDAVTGSSSSHTTKSNKTSSSSKTSSSNKTSSSSTTQNSSKNNHSDNDVSNDIPTETVKINSLDKLNYYAVKMAIAQNEGVVLSASFQKPKAAPLASNTNFRLLKLANSTAVNIAPDSTFTITMCSYFTVTLNDPMGFLAQKLGGTGSVEVVITRNNFNNMITFKKGERYYSCFQTSLTEKAMSFSSRKYVSGFKLVENYGQENYEYTVHFEGDKVVGINCGRFDGNDSHEYVTDDITFHDDFCVVIYKKQSFTAQQLEDLLALNNSFAEAPYTDIACAQVTDFLETTFTMENSNILFRVILPKDWGLAETAAGYDIVKHGKIIGRVTASENVYSPHESVNVFHREITSHNVTVTHSIDRVDSSSYTRTLCYNGDDKRGKYKKLVLTVNYEELDASAVYEMITQVEKDTLFTEKNMGVLKINDARKRVLILGNSFIRSSDIGNILQTMCASDGITVDARCAGLTSKDYSSDPYLMQEIEDGNFSAVFVCGFFGYNDIAQFMNFVDACETSNTKLAIFPAHNETRQEVDNAASMYPDIAFIDWKAEIDAFIDNGGDYFDFCMSTWDKHSTPLAGYVGAHMIYRAILNRMPTATDFDSVAPWEIDLLGDYPTTGQVPLFDQGNSYILP